MADVCSVSVPGNMALSRYAEAPSYPSPSRSTHASGVVLVVALHLFLLWALVTGTARDALNSIKKPLQAVVIQEVTLPPPPPPPPSPSPSPKETAPPKPMAPREVTPMPIAQPDVPAPQAVRPMEKAPEPAPVAKPVPASPTPPAAVAPPTPAPAPAVDTHQPQIASVEGDYVSKLRSMLNATKRYPTGRQASQQRPQGTVKVWFTLARNGALLDVGVLQSSESNLLDDAAVASVRRGVYPPFPPQTWPGQESHKFSVDIDFSPPSAG